MVGTPPPQPTVINTGMGFKEYLLENDQGIFIDTKNEDKRIELSLQQYTMLVDKSHLKPIDDEAERIVKKAGSFDQR